MRRIAVINQKGGVGKTTTTANLGAALAEQGRRVVLVDMDAQANLSLSLGVEADSGSPTSYTVLAGEMDFTRALRATAIPNLSLVPSNIDLSGAELELASQIGREFLLRDALKAWEDAHRKQHGRAPADYVLFDCPPSLGLLAINALAASGEVLITLQTEFLALQGMSKLVEVVQLLRKRLNPELVITGILPCLYESRVRLAREVLGEIKQYFPGQVFPVPIRSNVKLAEAPSFGQTIFQYAPDSIGAVDYRCAAREMLRMEARDPDLAGLPPFRDAVLAGTNYSETPRYAPSKRAAVAAAPAKTPGANERVTAQIAATTPTTPTVIVPAQAPSTPAPKTAVTTSVPAASAHPTTARTPKRASKSATKPGAGAAPSTAERAPDAKRTQEPTPARSALVPAAQQPAPKRATITPRDEPAPRAAGSKPAARTAREKRAPSASKPERVVPAGSPPPTPVANAKPPKATPPAPKPVSAPAAKNGAPSDVLVPVPRRTPKALDEERRARKVSEAPAPRAAGPRGAAEPTAEERARPAPRPATRSSSTRADEDSRVVRADELPPLPPDAFEILANFGLDP